MRLINFFLELDKSAAINQLEKDEYDILQSMITAFSGKYQKLVFDELCRDLKSADCDLTEKLRDDVEPKKPNEVNSFDDMTKNYIGAGLITNHQKFVNSHMGQRNRHTSGDYDDVLHSRLRCVDRNEPVSKTVRRNTIDNVRKQKIRDANSTCSPINWTAIDRSANSDNSADAQSSQNSWMGLRRPSKVPVAQSSNNADAQSDTSNTSAQSSQNNWMGLRRPSKVPVAQSDTAADTSNTADAQSSNSIGLNRPANSDTQSDTAGDAQSSQNNWMGLRRPSKVPDSDSNNIHFVKSPTFDPSEEIYLVPESSVNQERLRQRRPDFISVTNEGKWYGYKKESSDEIDWRAP